MYTPTAVFTNQPKAAAPAGPTLLIDDVGVDAVLAFGLRKLRNGYTGDAIEVRRASDNATQDIGFSGEDLDTSALATFCAGTNGYIRTWYDQSGNGNDIVQTTSGLQALIYDSTAGTVTNSNGNVACRTTELGDTSATGDYVYQSNTFTANKTPTVCMVMEFNTHNGNGICHAEVGNGFAMGTYGNPYQGCCTIRSDGGRIHIYGGIALGDSFAIMNFLNDDGGTNNAFMIGSSDGGIGQGGTLANNTETYTAAGFNAPTYDNIQLFYCCAPSLYQNMYFSEYVFWDISTANTSLATSEQQAYFDNVNTYYTFQF